MYDKERSTATHNPSQERPVARGLSGYIPREEDGTHGEDEGIGSTHVKMTFHPRQHPKSKRTEPATRSELINFHQAEFDKLKKQAEDLLAKLFNPKTSKNVHNVIERIANLVLIAEKHFKEITHHIKAKNVESKPKTSKRDVVKSSKKKVNRR